MKHLALFLLLIVTQSGKAQDIEILARGQSFDRAQNQEFIYIAPDSKTAPQTFVAKIRATGSLKDISKLYQTIRREAQGLGANSFKFESFKKTDDLKGELILDVFQNPEDFFDYNFKHVPKNKVYIFGSANLTGEKSQNYKLKGQKYEIGAGKYSEFDISAGEEIKINKGGITGMTLWLGRTQYGHSYFLNFAGIGLSGASVNMQGGMGVSINTGSIHKLDAELALLLLHIYEKQ